MKNFVNKSIRLNEKEDATLKRAVDRAVKSIFEREKSPLKRRVLLDSIPFAVYGHATFATLMKEFDLVDEEEEKKSAKKKKKVKKASSKS
jgi:hypothetical protein